MPPQPPSPVRRLMQRENPWWDTGAIRPDYAAMKRRGRFARFARLAEETGIRRAVLLMGARRVGKTVLLHQWIASLLERGLFRPREICYLSLDQPLYTRLSLEELVEEAREAAGGRGELRVLALDEIPYLAGWERHLKAFVDTHPGVRCVASGSAAAALRLRSAESGAGRFTDFLLPPLSFREFLDLQGAALPAEPGDSPLPAAEIAAWNRHFLDYLNFGGFPEAFLAPAARADPHRTIGLDVVRKVLTRDLAQLYGVQDVSELAALFTMLAESTGREVSMDALSKQSGVSKPTLSRYLQYLEATFLIRRLRRIDASGRRFQRANHFKAYLTTPSLRSALFGPVKPDDEAMGRLVETAVFAQNFAAGTELHYARWRERGSEGEVDFVHLGPGWTPDRAVEVKWSDRFARRPQELAGLAEFARRHPQAPITLTTRSFGPATVGWPGPGTLRVLPASLYCHGRGKGGSDNCLNDKICRIPG